MDTSNQDVWSCKTETYQDCRDWDFLRLWNIRVVETDTGWDWSKVVETKNFLRVILPGRLRVLLLWASSLLMVRRYASSYLYISSESRYRYEYPVSVEPYHVRKCRPTGHVSLVVAMVKMYCFRYFRCLLQFKSNLKYTRTVFTSN